MNKFYAILIALFAFLSVHAQEVVTITDADLGAETYTWTSDKTYLLDGFVFLEEGGVLNIEAGTVIKGKEVPTSSDNASALIITRGAQIFANGTEDAPIIFTAEVDDTNDAEDLTPNDRGLWGGLIILGKAQIANPTAETRIEGIPEGEDRALFGGSDDMDDSGSLSYVSIRHGGAELSPGDEINGLTLGAVGSGTTLDHIEVIANSDDGIEFFGGTVSLKFAAVSFCGDDSYDWDLGFRGKGQFWLALLGDDDGDNGGELDGAKPDDGEPTSNPTVYNATFIGAGCQASASNSNAMLFRDGSAGTFANSIFTEFNFGVEVEDRASGTDSRQRYEDGDLVLTNSLWYNFCNGNELNAGDNGFIRVTGDAEDPTAQWLIDGLAASGNALDNANLKGIGRATDGSFDPRPEFGGAAYGNLADLPDDSFFQVTGFKGAFGASQWLAGWTALAEYGVLAEETTVGGCENPIIISDDDLVGGQSYTWTNNNCYILDGFVFLEDGGTLTIQEGTVIKGRETPSTGDNASALIIARGAQIFANGSEEAPIIFTAEIDDTNDPSDLTPNDRGLWGGLIILGNAQIANPTAETRIEGIPEGEPRALFGGTDDTDDSGSLSYVSIRHGGAELSPGDEINGLTLGAVGSGTTMDHIEVIANSDDGIEFFGGTVSLKFASVSFCGDDSYDWDLGFRGKGQFWFALLGDDDGDNGGELDGAKPDDGEPTSNPTIYNATYIGAGCNASASNSNAMLFRDGSAGTMANSIFTAFNFGVEVEDRASGTDSRQRYEDGDLVLANSLWYDFCNGNELNAGANGFIRVTGDAEDPTAQWLIDGLAAAGNALDNPNLGGISRATDNGLDPRPEFGGAAYGNLADLPDDSFFQVTGYKGAFGASQWLASWTALAEYGVLGEETAAGCTNEIIVSDDDLQGGQAYTWTNDNCYILDGFVFLEDGGTLTIQEGTVIKGRETPSTGDNASALIITRGAQIFANGSEDAPIIFTAEIDDTDDPSDLTPNDRGLWGGLIILGNAQIANPTAETRIEGIPEGEPRALFGGTNDEDNSGSLSYVSIRHGGAELSPGDEINGLTLGAVGSGTTMDHIEVLANSDDGIEFFGGTVSLKFASVAFCGDDSYDWDLGYRGKGQFWFALLGDDDGDNGGELDGAKPDDGEPTSNPVVYNATFIGAGCQSSASNSNAMLFRDGSAGTFANSIFTEFNYGVEVEDRASGVDSRQRYENGDLVLANSLWYNFCNGNELNAGDNGFIRVTGDAEDPTAQWLIDGLAAAGNALDNPNLGGISRTTDNGLDPRPEFGGAAYGELAGLPDDNFYQVTSYKGAFGASQWLRNWTALDEYGLVSEETTGGGCDNPIVIGDDDIVGGATYNWTNDNCYILDGFVFVEAGAILNIEAGTIIKGRETPSTGDNASALIITRGATINAEGNGAAPIIFTAEIDDTDDNSDLTPNDRGLWGGVIILGNAQIANPTAETRIEGIPEGEPRALFGGTDDTDNSGIMRYVSIRHGGAELSPGDEINGLTLGAVGSETTLEHIEVIANSDDGIEFFGGTVGLKYASVSFCGDDSYDWDLGYRGQGQFWLALLGDDDGDNGGELDGAKPDDGEPTSQPTIYNATFIGAGCDATASNSNALLFRDGTAGIFSRGILTGFNEGIEVEDRASGLDSRQRMEDGDLVVSDNVWYGFCAGETLDADGFIRVTGDAEDANAQFLIDHLAGNGNQIFDAGLAIARDQSGGFNPLPTNDEVSNADDGVFDIYTAAGDFFTPVCFRGAFGNNEVWIQDWTALAEYGVLDASANFGDGAYSGDATCVVSLDEISDNGYRLSQNVPNPARMNTMVEFELPKASNVNLSLFNVNGRLILSLLDNARMVRGTHQVTFDTSNLPNGVYYYTLTNSEVQITKQLVVNQ